MIKDPTICIDKAETYINTLNDMTSEINNLVDEGARDGGPLVYNAIRDAQIQLEKAKANLERYKQLITY